MSDPVDHPAHYGGADNPYEAIKVILAWGLGFCLGNTVKYIARAGKKSDAVLHDLKKARWYLDREIAEREAALPPPAAGGTVGAAQSPAGRAARARRPAARPTACPPGCPGPAAAAR